MIEIHWTLFYGICSLCLVAGFALCAALHLGKLVDEAHKRRE